LQNEFVMFNQSNINTQSHIIFIIMKRNHDDLQSSFVKSDRLKIDDWIFVVNVFD